MNEPPMRDEGPQHPAEPRHSAPPIPPPSAYSCPKCGLEMNEALPYCPRCGAKLERGMRFAGCFIFLLAVMSLPSALAGACFLLFSSSSTGGGEFGIDRVWGTVVGLVCIGFAVLCVWGIIRINKVRRG